MQPPKQKKPISARDQEIIDTIINCTCAYFSIHISAIGMAGKQYTKIRRICFFLIAKNTDISVPHIAQLFNKDRSEALRGIDLIAAHSNIYASFTHQMKDIVNICNKFTPKQFEWHIQY